MSAKSSKGLTICITKGTAAPTDLIPTAITQAAPAVVTCTVAGVANGDLVFIDGTGMASIDGKIWTVANVGAADLELLGSDTTQDAAFNAGATLKANHYGTTDMECLCLSSLSVSSDTPGTVDVGTYCDPTASLPSAATSAGTLDFAGYVDITDTDYAELLLAAEDGKLRYIRIMLPSNGYIVAPVTFASMTWDLPLDGAVGYSGTAVLGSKPRHLF